MEAQNRHPRNRYMISTGYYNCNHWSLVFVFLLFAAVQVCHSETEKELPKVSFHPNTPLRVQLANQGIYIECRNNVAGKPYPHVTWIGRDGNPLPEGTSPNDHPEGTHRTGNHSGALFPIPIPLPVPVDGFSTDSVIVHSTTPTSDGDQGQAIGVGQPSRATIIPAGPIHGRVGDPVTAECAGQAPDDTVYWRRGAVDGPVVGGPAQGKLNLQIPDAKIEDSGQYVCVVVDANGGTESTPVDIYIGPIGVPGETPSNASLIPGGVVPVIPVVPPNDQTVTATDRPSPDQYETARDYRIEPWYQQVPIGLDSNATFECIHPRDGQISITYTWTREDDQPLPAFARPHGKYLIFDATSDASAGKYICTISPIYELKNLECELAVCDPDLDENCQVTKERPPKPVLIFPVAAAPPTIEQTTPPDEDSAAPPLITVV
ncbi:myosin light chain kinase, smooth muscle-like [Paramacrobiotus metropolitanus]|uniref:myosin light chain kinase, smooth muscle-like n=1 Tax=Paramacrobiotus metropolitanus TaxID=2943436 RepID=UPI002445A829|nr:myosin light chain kinase, smooth muscle-like [Paramacrobiotus metropolitanus]